MKNFKILLVAILAMLGTCVNAQSENAPWKGVRVSYNSFTIEDADAIMALEAGYVHSFAVKNGMNLPLFVEAGANLFWANGDISEETSLNMLSVAVPVNIGYKYKINDALSIFPYVGINLRANILGDLTMEYDDEEESVNIFDDDEMDDAWSRIQIGAHVGVTANYNNYNLGLKYGFDINEIAEDTKCKALTITLGYNF